MTQRFATSLLSALLALTLGGCLMAPDDQSRDYPSLDQIPMEIPPAETDLATWQAPPQLGDYRLQGEATLEGQRTRILRYSHARDESLIDVTLFPLPGGWDTMTPTRAVAGQYGQQRQRLIERALRHGAQEVEPQQEGLVTVDGISYPIATGRLAQRYSATTLTTLLQLTALPPVFVLATASVPTARADDTDPLLREALQAIARLNADKLD